MRRRHDPRRTVRILAATCLAATLAAPTVATASTRTAATPGFSRLAGTTTVYAVHSARGVVRVPRAVTLHTAPGDDHARELAISGRGRMIGFALVSADGRTGFAQIAVTPCFDTHCTHPLPGYPRQQIAGGWSPTPPPMGASAPPTTFTLPAGDYVVSVFTDGAPVRVTLRLPQLSGHTHLDLGLPRHAQVVSPPEHSPAAPASPLSSQASGTGTVGTNAVMLGFEHASDDRLHVSNDVSWCIYDAPGPPAGAFTDDCPGGSGATLGATFISASYRAVSYGIEIMTGPGIDGGYFQGVDDTGVQDLTDVHDNLMWADLGTVAQT